MEATNLINDVVLPEMGKEEVENYQQLSEAQRWFLTEDNRKFADHVDMGKPAVPVGELYALGFTGPI